MTGTWTRRLTLGIACVALFAAAGGPSYAAKTAKKISGSKIKKNSIPANRLTDAARASLKGTTGLTKIIMRSSAPTSITQGNSGTAAVSCLAGERATGGGVYNESNIGVVHITSSYPTPNPGSPPSTGNGGVPTGWKVWAQNVAPAPATYSFEAYVICAS